MKNFNDYGISRYEDEFGLENVGRIIEKRHYYYDVFYNGRVLRNIEKVRKLYETSIVVGDFVSLANYEGVTYIDALNERKSKVSKQSSHASKSFNENHDEQLLAANVDQVFILIAADQRFTLSKFERYYAVFNQPNIDLHVLISKADYVENMITIIDEISSVYPNIMITPISMNQEETIESVKALIEKYSTSMFIGASGVGKSTLVNALSGVGELTNDVRSDGKGKHTTTHTKLIPLEETSSYLIDTPGFKTISTTAEIGLEALFQPIYDKMNECKFNDCSHKHEPGCAVIAAVESGDISEVLYERYLVNEKKFEGQLKHENNKESKKARELKKKLS
ncbi:ribosome small subunit-dependent GTPase A [Aliicoccus persicus]|uniref:Small ribosomal subunit biogenesis GTPase RsgA n=1 Tax=Aliicoccus persicus TaxID=930138 RepID=A0A662Z975_9STAP|nr:ribosome small subunit-dependent GTPase A [Aliicoccus persicus]SEW18909.1 ribosome biogenesis GTPase [Aliicoccus persicus]